MKDKMKQKWFTLIEMLIVIFIIWILSVVLVESYITISRTALRIEQEKNLSEEALILTQTFQAISDEATIDYEKYNEIDLQGNGWFTDKLYLTWWQRSWTSIYTSGGDNCLELEWNFSPNEDWSYPDFSNKVRNALTWCELILEQGEDNIVSLVPSWKVIVSKVKFRVIPYDSDENYFDGDGIVTNDVHQPAFWMFIHLYAPFYQPTWTNKIDQPLQLFFNLKL